MITAVLVLQALLLIAVVGGVVALRRHEKALQLVPVSQKLVPALDESVQHGLAPVKRQIEGLQKAVEAQTTPSCAAEIVDVVRQAESRIQAEIHQKVGQLSAGREALEVRMNRQIAVATAQLEEVLRFFLDPEFQAVKADSWLSEPVDDDGDALETLEAAFTRFPSSRRVFDELARVYLGIADETASLITEREALVRLRQHTGRFEAVCSRSDLAHARDIRSQLSERIDQLINQIEQRQRQVLEAALSRLENEVDGLRSNGKPFNEAMEHLAQHDEAINSGAIERYPELRARYDEVSRQIIELLQEGDNQGEERAYDQRAVAAARKAWERFKSHEEKGFFNDGKNDFNRKSNIARLVTDLGGWEAHRLLPSTTTYITSVYSEIFQKLNHTGRLELTSAMLKAPIKN